MVKHSCAQRILSAEQFCGFFLIWILGCSPDGAGGTEVAGAVSTPRVNPGRVDGLEIWKAADAPSAPAGVN